MRKILFVLLALGCVAGAAEVVNIGTANPAHACLGC
jgi:hypothetical protein